MATQEKYAEAVNAFDETLIEDCWAEIVRYLDSTAGCTIYGVGKGDVKVIPAVEAQIAMLLCRYICEHQCSEEDVRYIRWESVDSIRYWTGKDWEQGDTETMKHLIKAFLTKIDVGLVYRYYSPKRLALEVMSELCHHTERQYIPSNEYIGFKNGVLKLETQELLPFSMSVCPKFTIDFEYDKDATCPKFELCLSQALDDDTALCFQELCGNLLMDFKHEVIGILIGNGNDGKSTILEALSAALGDKDVTHYNLVQITETDGRYIANMENKIANIVFDSSQKLNIGNENIFKSYCSGEPLVAKTLYKQPRMTRNYPKSLIGLNLLPSTSDFSHGYFRRLKLIPFIKQIPADKVNLNLKDELREERAGILNWLIDGMIRLKRNGRFTESAVIKKTINAYRTDSDSVASFLEDENYGHCESPDYILSDLFSKFRDWQVQAGFQSMTNRKFAARLRTLGYKVDKQGGIMRVWCKQCKPQKEDENLPF